MGIPLKNTEELYGDSVATVSPIQAETGDFAADPRSTALYDNRRCGTLTRYHHTSHVGALRKLPCLVRRLPLTMHLNAQ